MRTVTRDAHFARATALTKRAQITPTVTLHSHPTGVGRSATLDRQVGGAT
jgi:hypothetical protein